MPSSHGGDLCEPQQCGLHHQNCLFSANVALFSRLTSARIYRPCFRENKPKMLVFSNGKRAFWASFHENWDYKIGHRSDCHEKEDDKARVLQERGLKKDFSCDIDD